MVRLGKKPVRRGSAKRFRAVGGGKGGRYCGERYVVGWDTVIRERGAGATAVAAGGGGL